MDKWCQHNMKQKTQTKYTFISSLKRSSNMAGAFSSKYGEVHVFLAFLSSFPQKSSEMLWDHQRLKWFMQWLMGDSISVVSELLLRFREPRLNYLSFSTCSKYVPLIVCIYYVHLLIMLTCSKLLFCPYWDYIHTLVSLSQLPLGTST